MSKETGGYTIFDFPHFPIFDPDIPQVDVFSSEHAVMTSLARYTNLLNTNGEIDALVMTHKKDSNTPSNHFVVSKPQKNVPNEHGHSFIDFYKFYFATDGDYSLALGMHMQDQTEPYWGAVTSFTIHNSGLDGPLITQLQRRRASSVRNDSTKEAFDTFNKNYHWEFALVNLVSLWAERAGMKSLYIQPGEANKYSAVMGIKSAKERYDKKAAALGFDPDPLSKAYKLVLSS